MHLPRCLAGSLALFLLAGAAAQPGPARKDLFGDSLPAGAVQRLGTLRHCQQDSYIDALAFAPDGQTYATVANTEKVPTVRLWHTATGQEFLRLSGASVQAIVHVAFAPDGKTIAASTHYDVVIWDVATGKQLRRFELPQTFIHCFAWSPDGQVLALGCQRATDDPLHTLRLLDAGSGKLLREIHAHQTFIKVVAFSPDGKRLASCSEDCWLVNGHVARGLIGDVCLWDAQTGKLLRRLDRGPSRRRVAYWDRGRVSLSRDLGRVAFWSQTYEMELWDLNAETRIGVVADFPKRDTFALTPDGRHLVSYVADQPLTLWDAEAGRQLRVFTGKLGPDLHRLVADPAGKYLAVLTDNFREEPNRVRLWEVAGGRELTGDLGHQDTITFAQATADGQHSLTAALDGTLRLWETTTGKLLRLLPGYVGQRGTVALAGDGTTAVAVADSGAIHRLELPAGKVQVLAKLGPGQVSHLALSPDGRTVAMCQGREPVALLDAGSGKVLAVLDVAARRSAFSPDGQILVTMNGEGSADRFQLWQVSTAKALPTLERPASWTGGPVGDFDAVLFRRTFAISPDGRWLAVSQGERNFSDHGVSWMNTRVFLWEVASGRLVRQFTGLTCDAGEVAFLPGGWVLAAGANPGQRYTGSDRATTLWDLADGRFLGRLEGHPGIVSTVACSPDGSVFLTGSADHTVLVWEAQGLPRPKPVAVTGLPERRLRGLWEDLADTDARQAFDALLALQAGGRDTIAFLQKRLQAVPPLTSGEREALEQLVADLDDPRYAVRARASNLLEKHGEFAVPVLRKALKPGVPVETRRRVELLLARLERFTPPAAQLRELRALAVLEYLGTPQARAVVEALAAGAPETRLTQQARATLERLHPTGPRRRWLPG
jgi:WD40 repeat protein